MSTSKKHRTFVAEPMGSKLTTEIPGVGNVLGARLGEAGYTRASHLYGEFLSKRQEKAAFQQWMKTEFNASSKQQADCYNSMREWTDRNF
ncbi:barrier-to-autointegration factor-like [Anticarsia gemmatalis]|uniref:barrier-to-autointegration factor-like n=1 Tax=Anticarsia gemmatalis TaxID=129554 RepID=UPI003F773C8A